MIESLKELPSSALVLIIALITWVATKLWERIEKSRENHDTLLQQNTLALIELKTELKNLKETIHTTSRKVDNLQDDVNFLHQKRRDDTNGTR